MNRNQPACMVVSMFLLLLVCCAGESQSGDTEDRGELCACSYDGRYGLVIHVRYISSDSAGLPYDSIEIPIEIVRIRDVRTAEWETVDTLPLLLTWHRLYKFIDAHRVLCFDPSSCMYVYDIEQQRMDAVACDLVSGFRSVVDIEYSLSPTSKVVATHSGLVSDLNLFSNDGGTSWVNVLSCYDCWDAFDFSMDGSEFIFFADAPDTSADQWGMGTMCVYDIASDSTMRFCTVRHPLAPVICLARGEPIYFRVETSHSYTRNLYKYDRRTSELIKITDYEYPEQAGLFYLFGDSIMCEVLTWGADNVRWDTYLQ